MTKAGFWKKDWYHRLVPVTADTSVPPRGVSPELLQIGATLQEAESALNTDRKLAESFPRQAMSLPPGSQARSCARVLENVASRTWRTGT